MKMDQLLSKVSEYAVMVLAPKAQSWASKFIIGSAPVAVAAKAEGFIRMIGAVDESGEVNIEMVKAVVLSGFKTAGHVDLFGGLLGFDPADAEEFFAWLERG